jgi:hypothetical protein
VSRACPISRPAETIAGYRESITDYTKKIEELFAKMEGVRAEVLPPNRESIDDYFNEVWGGVHTLTAAVLPLKPEQNNPEKFKPYLEAEEARLDENLNAVDFVIDGTDTLMLITGAGRIEKVGTHDSFGATHNSFMYCRPFFHSCTCL